MSTASATLSLLLKQTILSKQPRESRPISYSLSGKSARS